MQITFGDLKRYDYFSADDPQVIYRKIDDRTAWIFRAYYYLVPVYEPAIGTPTDYSFQDEQRVTMQEPPLTNRYYPQRAA